MNGHGPVGQSGNKLTESQHDRELMARFARSGDRGVFETIVQRWDRRVLSFLAKATGNLEAAEDLRQEVFIRVYRYGASYDARYAFATWFFRIASNALSTWRKREGRRREGPLFEGSREAMEPRDEDPDPRRRAEAAEASDQVRALISRLGAEDRELLLYRFDLDMSYRQIGGIKDTPETTVKSRIYKLLGRLRRELERSEATERTRG